MLISMQIFLILKKKLCRHSEQFLRSLWKNGTNFYDFNNNNNNTSLHHTFYISNESCDSLHIYWHQFWLEYHFKTLWKWIVTFSLHYLSFSWLTRQGFLTEAHTWKHFLIKGCKAKTRNKSQMFIFTTSILSTLY